MPEERREGLYGLAEGLIRAGRELALRPQSFFKNMPTNGGYIQPLLFSLVIFSIVLGYNLALIASGLPHPGGQEAAGEPVAEAIKKVPILGALWVLGLLAGSMVLHCSFWLLKASGGYEATFGIFAYSSIANLLTIVPTVGQYIAPIYTLVLIMLGGKLVHGLSSARAVVAPILPAIIIWSVFIALALLGVIPLEEMASNLQ